MADPVATVERLLEEVDGFADPAARETTTALVGALLDLYGEGLAKVVDHVADADEDGSLAAALAGDDLVAHLLLLHGLHPVPVEERVRAALEEVRPYLESHGGDVELLGVADGVVRLRLEGSCSGCPSSSATLKLAIEDAIAKAAPDVAVVEADGVAEAPPPREQRRSWASVAMPALVDGLPLLEAVDGEDVLFVRRDERLLAYRPACPGCEASLGDGVLDGAELVCARCGHRYDVRRAGRCVDAPELHLEPVPLLRESGGGFKVALAAR
jgi:Fe-S cluster biogenesis protein NfuA